MGLIYCLSGRENSYQNDSDHNRSFTLHTNSSIIKNIQRDRGMPTFSHASLNPASSSSPSFSSSPFPSPSPSSSPFSPLSPSSPPPPPPGGHIWISRIISSPLLGMAGRPEPRLGSGATKTWAPVCTRVTLYPRHRHRHRELEPRRGELNTSD